MPQRHQGTKKKIDPIRLALLAKVHIAKKELNIEDEDYRAILEREFGKRSARDCTQMELEYLVDYFREKGWSPNGKRKTDNGQQCEALRARVYEIAGKIENGQARLKGLARKILGVDSIAWSRDVGKLRRLLAVLEKIRADYRATYCGCRTPRGACGIFRKAGRNRRGDVISRICCRGNGIDYIGISICHKDTKPFDRLRP